MLNEIDGPGWGWSDGWAERFARDAQAGEQPARVVGDTRRGCEVAFGEKTALVQLSGALRHHARSVIDLPVVGDWVVLGKSNTVVLRVLERSSCLVRSGAGGRGQPQTIAANVDVVAVVTAVGEDLSPRRIERYLVAIRQSGARAVVVINKCDKAGAEGAQAVLSGVVGDERIVRLSAMNGQNIDEFLREVIAGETVALVGSSGVGKTTLSSLLAQRDVGRTFAVRAEDDKGRHTTTQRNLLELPGGLFLIDTPGMREFAPWSDEKGSAARDVDAAFDDVAEFARVCRFRDCGHSNEPGCSVVAAVKSGAIGEERYRGYLRLREEMQSQKRPRVSGRKPKIKPSDW